MVAREPLTQRRQQLMDAAQTVVATAGLRGLTHRAVDRQAGLPEGSCSAYYRTRQALLIGVATAVSDQLQADVSALSEQLAAHRATHEDDDAEYAASRITQTFLAWLAGPELLVTRLELTLEGLRTEALGAQMSGLREQLIDLVERTIADQPDARVRAQTVVAALDGVLLAALRQPRARRKPFLQASLARLLSALHES